MAFLTLNNVTVPVDVQNGTTAIHDIGDRTQAFDGTYQVDIRTRKRVFNYSTKVLPPLQARSLRGLIQGEQIYFPFDTNAYSSAGQVNAAGAYTALRKNGLAPVQAFDENGTTETIGGSGALSSMPAVTNYLSAAQATPTSTGVFNAVGAPTTSIDATTVGPTQLSALKIITTLAAQGVETANAGGGGNTISGAINDVVVVSCYAYGTVSNQIQVQLVDAQHSTTLAASVKTLAAGWKRFTASFTLVATSTDLRMRVVSQTASQTFWVQGLMLEKNPGAGTVGSTWVPGGSGSNTVAAANLQYNALGCIGPEGLTFSTWATKPLITAIDPTLFNLVDTSGVMRLSLLYTGGALTIQAFGILGGSSSPGVAYSWDNAWHLITLSVNLAPSSGEFNFYLYADTALVLTANSTNVPTPSLASTYHIGHLNGAHQWSGRMDEVQILPFPVDATWVAGAVATPTTANNNYPPAVSTGSPQVAPTPFLYAAGDGIYAPGLLVAGQITKETVVGYSDNGTWRPNGRILDFTLTEV